MENENKAYYPSHLLWVYVSVLCMVVCTAAICLYYGWMELDEDSKLTETQVYMIGMLGCAVVASTMSSWQFRSIENIHPAVKNGIRWALRIMDFVYIAVILDICKSPEKDWLDIALACAAFLILGVAFIFAIKWYSDRHKKDTGESLEETAIRHRKENHTKRFYKRERLEKNTQNGIVNPGNAEIKWDGRATYINVRTHASGFGALMLILAILMVAGEHSEDYDVMSMCFIFAYFIGTLLLRIYIYFPISAATLHGAMSYNEGARYGLLVIIMYAVVCNILSLVVFEIGEWGWTDYIVYGPLATFLLFIVTYLIVTAGNRNNGHDFAFFDTEGYAKSLLPPEEYDRMLDEEKKKD